MMGIVIVSHGELGKELLACAEGVVGRQTGACALGLAVSESAEAFEARLGRAMDELENPAGVLVLCDMLGGTPGNVCLRLARDPKRHFELVTGAHLPMLISALANRHYMPLAQLAQKLVDDGPRGFQRPLTKLRDRAGRE